MIKNVIFRKNCMVQVSYATHASTSLPFWRVKNSVNKANTPYLMGQMPMRDYFLALFKFSVDFKRLDKSEAEEAMMAEFLLP